MSISIGTEKAALDALTDLVHTARSMRDQAEHDHNLGTMHTMNSIAVQLDRVRTRLLDEDADDYLPEAWAFVDAGRLTIARRRARLARRLQ
jgi:hypothetical protein